MASINRWVKYQEQKITQQERVQRKTRKDGDKGDLCWTEAGERLARRMLKYLEDCESTKVGVTELEEQVLFLFETGSDMVQIARRVKNWEKPKLVPNLQTRRR